MRRETLPPLREDYFELDRHYHYVNLTDPAGRRVVVELLEAHGYRPYRYSSREVILGTYLPLTVDTEKREYCHAGNVTCAAMAASHRVVLDLDEFLVIYDRVIKEQT
jgi:hypothetical protein